MKKLLLYIPLLLSLNASAQYGLETFWGLLQRGQVVVPPCPIPPCPVVPIVMPALSFTADSSRSNGSTWNENSGAQIVAGLPPPKIYYRRFVWADCESSTSQGNYSKLWVDANQPGGIGRFRKRMMNAADLGQLFAFGIMQFFPEVCSGGSHHDSYTYGGFCGSYPQYVHNLMQAESNIDFRDFNDGTSWIPGYNSPNWLARWNALQLGVAGWIDTATYTPPIGPRAGQLVRFKDMIAYVDVRGAGSYGEWHTANVGGGYDEVANWQGYNSMTDPGTYPTIATFNRIIDITVEAFNNYPCVIIINVLDCGHFDGLNNTKIPIEVAYHALTKTNAFGKIGLRRDQWGDDSEFYHNYLEDNDEVFNGLDFSDEIINRYKFNYITGEPPGYSNCQFSDVCRDGVLFGWIPNQVETLHAYNIGNGNWGGNAPTNVNSVDSIKKAWREMGSRVLVTGGTMTDVLQAGTSFNVTLAMRNLGLATEHRAYTTQIVLKNSGGTTVFTGTHSFQVKGFNPIASSTNFSTDFVLGAVTPGTGYNLYIQLVDPLNYAQPYQLWNTGQSGRATPFLVRSNITVIAGP